jgi:hypothetical protein
LGLSATLLALLVPSLNAASAQAATAPTAVTAPNTPFPEGKQRLTGYVNPEGSPVTACRFVYGPEAGSYTSEAPCANHPGDEVQALYVAATEGNFKLFYLEPGGTTGTGDFNTGSPLITNLTPTTGEFVVGQPLRVEGKLVGGIKNVAPGEIELEAPSAFTQAAVSIESERLYPAIELPFDTTAAEVQSALQALPPIGSGGASVRQVANTPNYRAYLITFQGSLADANVSQLRAATGSPPLGAGSESPHLDLNTTSEGGLTESQEVTARLEELTPGATYHYRLIAENAAGRGESEDAIFRTAAEEPSHPCPNQGSPGAGFLPECRSWEMVSPPDKNGGDVLADSSGTVMAADGSAAKFMSPSPFGDASGAGADPEYEAIRTPSGWQSHGILPAQPPSSFQAAADGIIPHYEGEFSPDLQTGVFFATHPLDSSEPSVENATNLLYLRRDLRSPGAGTYRLLTRCPRCAENGTRVQGSYDASSSFVGASSDFSHVVFESPYNLVNPANSPKGKLYEDEEGTLRLVGILPGGGAAAESTAVGPHAPSVEVLHLSHTVSTGGSKVFWTDGTNLYLRLDHETTVQLNESELLAPEGNGTAHFQDATPDGSKVFFTDEARLSEDAPGGPSPGGIYMYETTKPPTAHNLTYIGHGEILGASADGETVYFLTGSELNVWRQGSIRRIDPSKVLKDEFHGDNPNFFFRLAPAGQLLFAAAAPLGLTGQSSGYCASVYHACTQFYAYDPTSEALQCVSCAPSGEQAQGASAEIMQQVGANPAVYRLTHPISDDGRHVFFTTAAPLLPEDTNGVSDAYAFDTATSRLSLLSGGTDPYSSFFMDADPTGSNALFITRQPLSGWDTGTGTDLYDARVEGGLPEPLPVPAACEGESCRQPTEPMPSREPTSSESLIGPGNPKPMPPCRKGKVKRDGKCIKPKKRHRSHRRLAGTNRRGTK